MFIWVAVWSIFLSLISLSFLYPLRHHHKEAKLAKTLSTLLLLPGAIFAIFVLKATLIDQGTLAIVRHLSFLPFEFGVLITAQNAPLVAALVFSAVVFAFLLQTQKFVRNIFFFGIALSVVLIITTSVDLLVSSTLFSIGTVLLSFFSLREENQEDLVREITKDFLWQRFSDFFAFAALSWILLDGDRTISLRHVQPFFETHKIAGGLFFLAMAMRIAIMARSLDELSAASKTAGRNQDLNSLFVGIGASILLRQFHPFLFGDLKHNRFFIVVAAVVFVEAAIQTLVNKDRALTARNFRYLLVSAALVAQCLNLLPISTAILCLLIVVYPAVAVTITSKSPALEERPSEHSFISTVALKIPSHISFWLSNIFAAVIVPIYSNLLLYRLPQFALWTVQAPLRAFHTGSIKRSLLFTIILLYAYYSAWGPQ